MTDKPTDYRVLKAPFGRSNVPEGPYSIPSGVWVDVDGMQIRHEMGRNVMVDVNAPFVTFLEGGEWQVKMTVPRGAQLTKRLP